MKRPRRSSYSDFLNSYSLGSGSASRQTGGTVSTAGSVARKGGAGRSRANATASRVVTRTRENAARRDLIRASSKGPAPIDLRANLEDRMVPRRKRRLPWRDPQRSGDPLTWLVGGL